MNPRRRRVRTVIGADDPTDLQRDSNATGTSDGLALVDMVVASVPASDAVCCDTVGFAWPVQFQ